MMQKIVLFLTLIVPFQSALSEIKNNNVGSNRQPYSFAKDQTIVDIKKVIWQPLKVPGIPAGAEIAVLRGNLESAATESLVFYCPAIYDISKHDTN